MEKAGRSSVRPEADDEESIFLFEPEERVEGHHEAALRLGAAPGARDRLELAPKLGPDLARMQRVGAIPGALQPVDRLAHLADGPALDREARHFDHSLVAVVERVEPMIAIEVEPAV